jgi:hypothetical protein
MYRLYLDGSERIEVPVDEITYIFYYGIIDPDDTIVHKDGDVKNNNIDNLELCSRNKISHEIKLQACELYNKKGNSYAEIGRKLGITRHQARDIIRDEYGEYATPKNIKFNYANI